MPEPITDGGPDFSLLERAIDNAMAEIDRLREALANSCACSHDGRGELTSECQEHQQVREDRDALLAALQAVVDMYGPSTEYSHEAASVWRQAEAVLAKVEVTHD